MNKDYLVLIMGGLVIILLVLNMFIFLNKGSECLSDPIPFYIRAMNKANPGEFSCLCNFNVAGSPQFYYNAYNKSVINTQVSSSRIQESINWSDIIIGDSS